MAARDSVMAVHFDVSHRISDSMNSTCNSNLSAIWDSAALQHNALLDDERFGKKNPGNDDSFDVLQHISDSISSIRTSNFKISEFYFCLSKISKI